MRFGGRHRTPSHFDLFKNLMLLKDYKSHQLQHGLPFNRDAEQLHIQCTLSRTLLKLQAKNLSYLSLVLPSQKNQNSSWGDGRPQVSLVLAKRFLVGPQPPWLLLGWVILGCPLNWHSPSTSVLLSVNLLFNETRCRLRLFSLCRLGFFLLNDRGHLKNYWYRCMLHMSIWA